MNYELTTIKDIFDKVPADKWPILFNELLSSFYKADLTRELIRPFGVEFALQKTITWVDDGESSVTIKVQDHNGEEVSIVKTKA